METTNDWLMWTGVALAAIGALLVWYVIHKGRPRPGDHVFRASRLTGGNRIFPAQVIVTSSSVTMFKPQFIGRVEESLHINHVASIKIDTNVVFSDIVIETTGGRQPLVLHGHTKGDAVAIKDIIEKFQTEYYKKER
jgi:hypothetical protein